MLKHIQQIMQRIRARRANRRTTNASNIASSTPSDTINANSKGLLDLPPEVRQLIYELVMPHVIDVRIMQGPGPFSSSRTKPNGKIVMDTTTGMATCAECQDIAHTAAALMLTCKTLRDEFGPRFYSMTDFTFSDLHTMVKFIKHLPPQFPPLIKWVSIWHESNPKQQKTEIAQLRFVFGALTGLEWAWWRGVDRMVDPAVDGTEWREFELRKLQAVLNASGILTRTYLDVTSCVCHANVYLTGSDSLDHDTKQVSSLPLTFVEIR
jgi:hypothetical protein